MTITTKPKQFAEKIQERLALVCGPGRLEVLARQSRFIQRASSKMTGQDFVALMTTDMLDDPTVSCGGLCDMLRQRSPHAILTPQALHQRLNTPQAVAYLQEVFQLALRAQLEPLYAHCTTGLLDVHFLSSLPVKQRPTCTVWADKRPVQMVWAVRSTRPAPGVADGACD
jgi:hypothetical protein